MLFEFDEAERHERAPELPTDGHPDDPQGSEPSSRRSSNLWLVAALGLMTGLVVAGLAWVALSDSDESLNQADLDRAIDDALAATTDASTDAADAFNQIAPSLVLVRTTPVDSVDDPSPNGTAIGSGVVINDAGQILTANHIVDDAASIEVVFANGTSVAARLVTSEPDKDIAVLESAGRTGPLTPAVLGNSRTIAIGDPIFAVGNPLGLTGSITAGVVSGLNRDIPFPGEDGRVFEDLIQFDAAVNQGNSGGPLLNAEGQVIGIVTALADPSSSGFFIGIGFAVPIDIAAAGAVNGPSQ